MSWSRAGQKKTETKGNATISWEENASRVEPPELVALGEKPNQWYDQAALLPDVSTLKPWKDRSCLADGAGDQIILSDKPQIGIKGGNFKLYIVVKATNPKCAPAGTSKIVASTYTLGIYQDDKSAPWTITSWVDGQRVR